MTNLNVVDIKDHKAKLVSDAIDRLIGADLRHFIVIGETLSGDLYIDGSDKVLKTEALLLTLEIAREWAMRD